MQIFSFDTNDMRLLWKKKDSPSNDQARKQKRSSSALSGSLWLRMLQAVIGCGMLGLRGKSADKSFRDRRRWAARLAPRRPVSLHMKWAASNVAGACNKRDPHSMVNRLIRWALCGSTHTCTMIEQGQGRVSAWARSFWRHCYRSHAGLVLPSSTLDMPAQPIPE